MKIYSIGHKEWTHDCYSDFVIVANNEAEVREMAKEMSADEGEAVWETAEIDEEGVYTGKHTEPFCLLASFHAG